MVSKCLALLVIAAFVAQGQALTEITLADEHSTFISNPLWAKTISIAKSWLDTLESCHLILPSGQIVEAYPNNQINIPNIYFLESTDMFRTCGVGIKHPEVSQSGIYELLSLVHHSDNSRSLTRQRFHLTFVLSEVEFPLK